MSQPLQRGDQQIPIEGATNQHVTRFSRLTPRPVLALRVWMRDITLGRKEGSVNMHQERERKTDGRGV